MRGVAATLYAGVVSHTATLLIVILDPRYLLLSNGADYFLWASWALALAYVALRKKLAFPLVGAFIVPLVVLFMGSSSYLLHKGSSSLIQENGDAVRGLLLPLLHAVPALVAFVSLILALVVSVVFLIVSKRLKAKKRDVLDVATPNLERLDTLNKQLLQTSFIAISFVILSGGLWAVSAQKAVFSDFTAVVSGLITWILLAFVLYARMVRGCSMRRFARLSLFASGLFLLSVLLLLLGSARLSHGGV
jgi:ABC-type transport system involved in cytochrome c biogenesis permease subunit